MRILIISLLLVSCTDEFSTSIMQKYDSESFDTTYYKSREVKEVSIEDWK